MRRPRGPRNERPVALNQPERRAQAAPAGVGEREHGLADADRAGALGVPRDRRRVAGVHRDRREVEVGVRAGDPAVLGAAVGERHRHLLAAQHVRVGEDDAVGRDDAGAAAPAAAEADDGGADRFGRAGDRVLSPR